MERIAGAIVLSLGRLTFAALHAFEYLGVDVTKLDDTLASWTARDKDLVAQLKAALASIQTLKDTDAAEDAAQAEALTAEIEAKVQAAYDTVVATEETGDVTGDDLVATEPEGPGAIDDPSLPGPPNDPPSDQAPVTDIPVVPSGDPENVPVESIPDPAPVEVVDPVVEEPVADEPVEAEPVNLDEDGRPVE